MDLSWFHWAILGIILMVSELMVTVFVLVWFGLGALVVALILAVSPTIGFTEQLLIWIVASMGMVVLWFKVFKPHYHKTLIGRSSAQVIGEVGLLVSDIAPFQNARVRFQTPLIGSDIWECIADEPISAGTRVKVVSVEGNLIKITRTETHHHA